MARRMAARQIVPAQTLGDVYKTISPEPLMTQPEIDAFYRDDLKGFAGATRSDTWPWGWSVPWGPISTKPSSWATPASVSRPS